MSRVCEQLPYKVVGDENNLELRELEVQVVHQNEDLKLQVVRIGPATPPDLPTKSILLVGETGSGKTTLINGCVNYLCGVRYDDNFRLRVKDFGSEGKQNSASQTDWITVYHLSYMDGMPHLYNYQLIDTPGFNDTRDSNFGKRQLQEFFSTGFGVTDLNMIGVAMNATVNRSTANIKRVLRDVNTCLGSSIEKIKVVLATHAVDGTDTLDNVLKGENFQYAEIMEFDNFPLFRKKTNTEKRWKDTHIKYSAFFDRVNDTSSVSLQYSRQLNETKQMMEQEKCMLKDNMKQEARLNKTLKETKKMIGALVEERDSITWMRQEEKENIKREPVLDGYHAHNCSICNRTCTDTCKIPSGLNVDIGNALRGTANGAKNGLSTMMTVAYVLRKLNNTTNYPLAIGAGVLEGSLHVGAAVVKSLRSKKCKFEEDGCSNSNCSHNLASHKEEKEKLIVKKDTEEVPDYTKKEKYDEIEMTLKHEKEIYEKKKSEMESLEKCLKCNKKAIYDKASEINSLVCGIYSYVPHKIIEQIVKEAKQELMTE